MARVVKNLFNDTTWTCPAGVTSVTVRTFRIPQTLINGVPVATQNLFLTSTGAAYTMGLNTNGQLGDNSVVAKSSPVAVVGGLTFNKSTLTGNNGVMALATNGYLYGWGANAHGQLGINSVTPASSPTVVVGGLKWRDFAFTTAVAAISNTGQLYSWGVNTNGEVGDASVVPKSSPVLCAGSLICKAVYSSGANYAMTTAGAIYAIGGQNTSGRFGDGSTTTRSSPVLVVGGLTFGKFPINALSGSHMVAIANNGLAYSWGSNAFGELGDGTVVPKSSPVAVAGSLRWREIIGIRSQEANFGISTDGDLYFWGLCSVKGEGGTGASSVSYSSPTLVVGGLKWVTVHPYMTPTSFWRAVIGLTTSGDLYAWGDNTGGSLGTNNTTSYSSPTLVSGGLKWAYLLRTTEPMAITANGDWYTWGYNDKGQVGVGDRTMRSSPTLVAGSFTGLFSDQVNSKVVPVTPGLTYDVRLSAVYCSFGAEYICDGPVESMTLIYEA